MLVVLEHDQPLLHQDLLQSKKYLNILKHSRKASVFFRAVSHNYSMINCASVLITHVQFTVYDLLVLFKYLTLY